MTSISVGFGNANSGNQVGINYGSIHLAPGGPERERPETPPPSLSTVPFRRDLDFVDRGTLLHQIYEKGTTPGARIALVGLGGVGKSQLAIEYCYRIRDRSPRTWVLWVHASSATRFEQSCRDIADRIKIPGWQDPKAHTFKLLHDWLHDESKGEWVLILDNVDDDQFLHEIPPAKQDGHESDQSCASGRPIWAYFPESLKGSIVVTSRSKQMVSRMVEDSDIIPVEPMDETHAIELFEKKLKSCAPKEDIIQLVAALEFMPLAIVQAAVYIKKRAPRLSVSQYLETFRASDHQKISLLDYEGGNIRRDREAKNSILVTWQISFDYISQTKPTAADLLSLMSFFDTQGIPEALLRGSKETKDSIERLSALDADNPNDSGCQDKNASESSVVEIFEDDILVLRDYSMITIRPDKTNFEMHRLVQLAMQEWLKTHRKLERWKERFIRNLYLSFPKGVFQNWPMCQMLFAHVQCAVTQEPHAETSIGEWASLLHEAAAFAWTRGNFVDSRRMAERAAKARNELFGAENEETTNSFEMLGLAYKLGGQWKKAEELQVQVLKIRKQMLGLQHPSTLKSMVNLASTYLDLAKLKDAEELLVQVAEKSDKEHSFALACIANLASTYFLQGRWKKAEGLQVRVMEIRKRVSGPEHPATLTSMNNLASTYINQARWEDAEELQIQVVKTRKQTLGPGHPDTLVSMNNLAMAYQGQGQLKEAEGLQVRVMKAYNQLLGPEHPKTLTSMASLALIYGNQGRWKDAEELQTKELKLCSKVAGPEHPSTLTSIGNLASTYYSQGRWKKAEELQVRVMEARKQILGPEHPSTLNSMACLAFTWESTGQHAKAIDFLRTCVVKQQQVLGPAHPDTVSNDNTLLEWETAHLIMKA